MSVATRSDLTQNNSKQIRNHGVNLLSQQIWCWGQDILRPKGNWLVELGFGRVAAPADRESCSSVYTLELPQSRRVVLRGFGVFYGDDALGGIFLPHFEFVPQYTRYSKLECPPWTEAELPKMSAPSEAQLDACKSLTFDLLAWIRTYEQNVAQRLGVEYRQATLDKWVVHNGPITLAAEMADAWQSLGAAIEENFDTLVRLKAS